MCLYCVQHSSQIKAVHCKGPRLKVAFETHGANSRILVTRRSAQGDGTPNARVSRVGSVCVDFRLRLEDCESEPFRKFLQNIGCIEKAHVHPVLSCLLAGRGPRPAYLAFENRTVHSPDINCQKSVCDVKSFYYQRPDPHRGNAKAPPSRPWLTPDTPRNNPPAPPSRCRDSALAHLLNRSQY